MAEETSVTRQPITPVETFRRRQTTRTRLTRLEHAFGDKLDAVLACCKDERTKDKFLAALCVAWFGPIDPNDKKARSDRGGWHWLPERVWPLTCEHCGAGF